MSWPYWPAAKPWGPAWNSHIQSDSDHEAQTSSTSPLSLVDWPTRNRDGHLHGSCIPGQPEILLSLGVMNLEGNLGNSSCLRMRMGTREVSDFVHLFWSFNNLSGMRGWQREQRMSALWLVLGNSHSVFSWCLQEITTNRTESAVKTGAEHCLKNELPSVSLSCSRSLLLPH